MHILASDGSNVTKIINILPVESKIAEKLWKS